MNFNDKLRFLLEEENMTQKELAKDLHIAPSTLGGYVQGVSEPDFDMLKCIANRFDVTTDYLLDYSKPNGYSSSEDFFLDSLETELVRAFRAMTTEQKVIYIEQGKAIVKINRQKAKLKAEQKKEKKGEEP